jgi:hypothetical protein
MSRTDRETLAISAAYANGEIPQCFQRYLSVEHDGPHCAAWPRGWMTTVIGGSLILLIAVAILSFVGLALTTIAGSQTVAAPSAIYSSFIVRTSMFGVPE